MKGLHAILIGVGIVLAATVAITCSSPSQGTGTIRASGTIDAETVAVTSEVGGRVQDVLVDEGDNVSEGTALIQLDTALMDAQTGEAEAVVLAAQVALGQLRAGVRLEEKRVAEAALTQAVALRDGARRSWENAQAILENPQELEDRIAGARTQTALAEIRSRYAEAALETAQSRRDRYPDSSAEYALAQAQVEVAEAALEQARAQLAGAQQALRDLLDILDNPIETLAQVHAAEAAFRQAEAAADAAQAQLDLLKAGATSEEIAAAEANLRQAQAALDALRDQREKMTLRAAVDGLVISRSIQPGEIAMPGSALMRLADLDRVELVVFVPETQIAKVHLQQPVEVDVDAYPGRVFRGEVTFIGHSAEFTPRNVQTQEQRANLVFAVTVSLDNPDHLLRPGMPADATLATD